MSATYPQTVLKEIYVCVHLNIYYYIPTERAHERVRAIMQIWLNCKIWGIGVKGIWESFVFYV